MEIYTMKNLVEGLEKNYYLQSRKLNALYAYIKLPKYFEKIEFYLNLKEKEKYLSYVLKPRQSFMRFFKFDESRYDELPLEKTDNGNYTFVENIEVSNRDSFNHTVDSILTSQIVGIKENFSFSSCDYRIKLCLDEDFFFINVYSAKDGRILGNYFYELSFHDNFKGNLDGMSLAEFYNIEIPNMALSEYINKLMADAKEESSSGKMKKMRLK